MNTLKSSGNFAFKCWLWKIMKYFYGPSFYNFFSSSSLSSTSNSTNIHIWFFFMNTPTIINSKGHGDLQWQLFSAKFCWNVWRRMVELVRTNFLLEIWSFSFKREEWKSLCSKNRCWIIFPNWTASWVFLKTSKCSFYSRSLQLSVLYKQVHLGWKDARFVFKEKRWKCGRLILRNNWERKIFKRTIKKLNFNSKDE